MIERMRCRGIHHSMWKANGCPIPPDQLDYDTLMIRVRSDVPVDRQVGQAKSGAAGFNSLICFPKSAVVTLTRSGIGLLYSTLQ